MRIGTRTRPGRESAPVSATSDGEAPAPPENATRHGPLGGRRGVAGWVVAVVATLVAAVALTQWLPLASRADDREEVAQVAGTVLSSLTNWEASSLEEVRTRLDGLATDRFRDEARALLGDVGQGLSQAEARSTGEVLDLAVEIHDGAGASADAGPTAAALAVVRQEIANLGLEAPRSDCWGARVVLKRVEGRWLVDALELYGPNACPEGL